MAYWWWWWREPSIYEMAEAGYTLLYVGDIEPTVTDSVLFDAFSQASQVSLLVFADIRSPIDLAMATLAFTILVMVTFDFCLYCLD